MPTKKEIGNYKNYKRFPIQLSSQDIILIHLFNDGNSGFENSFENISMTEESEAVNKFEREYNPANQFFKQLEGHYSDIFLEDIIIEATRLLVEGDNLSNKYNKRLNDPRTQIQNRAKEALDKAENVILYKRCVLVEKIKKNM